MAGDELDRGAVMNGMFGADDAVGKLLRRQIRLFEHAHKTPIELKAFGLSLKEQGIDRTKYYVNPAFLLLPFRDCAHLSALSSGQTSVLSALYFARAYSEIATSETLALRYNMLASEAVFPLYSDPYMVLFNETAEEFDHIITFRLVCQALVGRGDVIGDTHFPHLKTVPEILERYRKRLCNDGFAAMYLLMRYLLNLALKQLEAFMALGLSEKDLAPTAANIIAGHAADEARHLTTSLDLGIGLFRRATAQSRDIVRGVLRVLVYSMIDRRFSRDLANTWNFVMGFGVLEQAIETPEFAEFPRSAQELRREWMERGIVMPSSAEFETSLRWLAAQIAGLANRMEMALTPQGEAFDTYVEYVGHSRTGTATG